MLLEVEVRVYDIEIAIKHKDSMIKYRKQIENKIASNNIIQSRMMQAARGHRGSSRAAAELLKKDGFRVQGLGL